MQNIKLVKREIDIFTGVYKDIYMDNKGMLIGKENFPKAATFEDVAEEE